MHWKRPSGVYDLLCSSISRRTQVNKGDSFNAKCYVSAHCSSPAWEGQTLPRGRVPGKTKPRIKGDRFCVPQPAVSLRFRSFILTHDLLAFAHLRACRRTIWNDMNVANPNELRVRPVCNFSWSLRFSQLNHLPRAIWFKESLTSSGWCVSFPTSLNLGTI